MAGIADNLIMDMTNRLIHHTLVTFFAGILVGFLLK